jgi:hypothetical protein
MTKKEVEGKKKEQKRIINAHYRYYNLIIRRSCFSLSLFSLVNHFLSLVQSHTHNHNNMFSLRTTRACALFFVQIFPSLFSAIAVF